MEFSKCLILLTMRPWLLLIFVAVVKWEQTIVARNDSNILDIFFIQWEKTDKKFRRVAKDD